VLPCSQAAGLGTEWLDAQQRQLEQSFQELRMAADALDHAKLAQLLKELRFTAAEHFRWENSILWKIKTGTYQRRSSKALPKHADLLTEAAFEEHTSDHVSVLEHLDGVAAAPLENIIDQVVCWFTRHWMIHDAQLKTLIRQLDPVMCPSPGAE
jgi:hemerythrin